MHELSLIVAITQMILQDAALQGVNTITQIEIEVGELSGAFPYALKEVFPIATRNTIMENASLVIVKVPAEAYCQSCTNEFMPLVSGWRCPNCGKGNYRLKSGTELTVRSYTGE